MDIKNKYNTYYIVSLIDNEINKYENNIKKKDELESDLKICEDLISLLESRNYNLISDNIILFDTYLPIFFGIMDKKNKLIENLRSAAYSCALIEQYPDKYDKTGMEHYERDINKICNYLKDYYMRKKIEIQNYNQRITEEELIELKRIKNCFRFSSNIKTCQYDLLKKLFSFYNIKDTELILFLEVLKTFNNKLHINKKHIRIDFEELNKVTNMLRAGFEIIDIPYIEDKSMRKQLDISVNSIIQVADASLSFEDAKKMLPIYKGDFGFGDNLTVDDFKYLMRNLMLHYQKIQIEMIDEIKNLENYENKEYRNMVVEEYKQSIIRYCYFREFYYREMEKFELEQDKLSELEDVNIMHYAISGNSSKCLFERDLGDISPDRYSEIEKLLNRFKKDKLKPTESKVLHYAFDELQELRGDQIRILFKHLKDNEYVILGVFLKKDDNDITQYRRLNERINNAYISQQEAEESLNKVFGKKHKGGRNKS